MSNTNKVLQFPDGTRIALDNVASYALSTATITIHYIGDGGSGYSYTTGGSDTDAAASIMNQIDAAYTSQSQTVKITDPGAASNPTLTNIQYSVDGVTWLTCGTDPNPQSDPTGAIQYYWRANGTNLLINGVDSSYFIFVTGIGSMLLSAKSATQFTTILYSTSNAPGLATAAVQDESHNNYVGQFITFN